MTIGNYMFIIKRPEVCRRYVSTIKQINKLLIANRGEIACRIMKTAKKMGIQTVAVYSDVDKTSMHVSMADEAYRIGPANSQQSYLNKNKIIDVAKQAKCQAIHPGYGFLSENTEFAEQCQNEGVIFVGPPASAIRDMGIKSTSKAIMSAAGVPIIEGYHGEDQSVEKLIEEAEQIGFPIMIKAIRGGGGKGMRIAMTKSEFLSSLESAKSESMKSFGDDNVLLERFIFEPRHVEVQVFADTYGNTVHLFERDCSVQRRHQKIIEEAPGPGISAELRNQLGAAAVRAAKAVNYVGAGTVEFILDRHSHSFHFMEMNTRLQVEHPVTEMITGTDLVEWQLRIASGEELPLSQDEIKLNGHAFESRIYAEDPSENFMPRPGPLLYLSTPTSSSDVRVETGVRQNDEVSVHYDPMIAKLVVWGQNRSDALAKLAAKLTEYNIAGVETNINFLLNLSRHPEFVAGNVHTGFIENNNDGLFPSKEVTSMLKAQVGLATVLIDQLNERKEAEKRGDLNNPFIIESGFRVNHNLIRDLKFRFNDKDELSIKIKYLSPEKFEFFCDTESKWKKLEGKLIENENHLELICNYSGVINKTKIVSINGDIYIFNQSGICRFIAEVPSYIKNSTASSESNLNSGVSPMPGILEKILVSAGDLVKAGDPLFVIIAMKMEYVVKANRDATIKSVNGKVGESVPKNSVIVQFVTNEE